MDDAVRKEFDALNERITKLSHHIEWSHWVHAIQANLRDLSTNALKAHFASETEDGYVPPEEPNCWLKSEKEAHNYVSKTVDAISEYFENFYFFEVPTPALLELVIRLRYFAQETRPAAQRSFAESLNQIATSCYCLHGSFQNLRDSVQQEFQRLEKSE